MNDEPLLSSFITPHSSFHRWQALHPAAASCRNQRRRGSFLDCGHTGAEALATPNETFLWIRELSERLDMIAPTSPVQIARRKFMKRASIVVLGLLFAF